MKKFILLEGSLLYIYIFSINHLMKATIKISVELKLTRQTANFHQNSNQFLNCSFHKTAEKPSALFQRKHSKHTFVETLI